MKKLVALAFIGSLAVVSCSKKNENTLQDTNTMLDEPKKEVIVDSSYIPETEAESARMDSSKAKPEITTKVEEQAQPKDTVKTK